MSTTPVPIYLNLRRRILELAPAEAGLQPIPDAPNVWGVLMETGYDEGIITLVCLADGTTSLYFSTGGGRLGNGQHPAVAYAAKALVAAGEPCVEGMTGTTDFPLPAAGNTRFIVLTYHGHFTGEASEAELASGWHPLSRLYDGAQQVINEVRLLEADQPG
jgi:hypothetical protein